MSGAAGAAAGGTSGGTGGAQGAGGSAPGGSGTGAPGSLPSGGTAAAGGSAASLGNVSTPPGAGGANPGLTQDWTHGFTDDHKGFAQNKGWKNPTDVVNSYQNLEKMLGAPRDQIIQLPREDDAGAWESVHTRLGRPATPDGYKLTSPEGGDPDFVKGIAAEFHKAGLNEKQAQGLVQWWNSRNEAQTAAQKTEFLGKLEADKTSLKKEWGAAHDQNTAIAARAVREFGVDTKIIDAMEKSVGFAATMKFFQSIGSKLGEGSFVTGRPAGGALTPEAAKSQIAALKQDHEFVKKYIAGDHKSRERMEVLHRYAFPEG